ncbi:Beta-1,4-mannosyl-glycoprotein 4-beta-N-acetylglucosaminyltransferase [Lachnellula suecica]|uniref:Beta-1,4-mannosyl-glycoprotein 4-beta-N-acetylglucosaminyltransferase n=1 Tax=Lachnellula suecica TaxID=602035 RepID=A0A8T9BYV7_9HELO|nr:Beta-1,4-mannosyl-glycoprotein 4-beta-N-acetylglucosaminyltransferase [Lachnellula suecica]
MLLKAGRNSSYRRRWQWLLRTSRQYWRETILALLLLWLFARLNEQKHPFSSQPHAVTSSDISFQATNQPKPAQDATHHGFLPVKQARAFCQKQNWQPYPVRSTRRKIYDLFMLNDELDWLEIRLNTLSSTVDYFVVVESPFTFTGLPKPLTLKENWARFEKFHKQIIYHEVDKIPFGASRTWDYEDHQRNAMYLQVIPGLQGEQQANFGDVVLVSDVDEILRPATLALLRNCEFQTRLTLRSQFYYYGFQWLHRGPQWELAKATIYRGDNTILPADLRNGEGGNWITAWWDKAELWNAGWHCSTCFETVDEVLTKMNSFSHTSLNQEEFRNRTRIIDRVRNGLDLWDREGQVYDRIDDNKDVPEYLKSDSERFKYLLDRDGPNAGFRDGAFNKLVRLVEAGKRQHRHGHG